MKRNAVAFVLSVVLLVLSPRSASAAAFTVDQIVAGATELVLCSSPMVLEPYAVDTAFDGRRCFDPQSEFDTFYNNYPYGQKDLHVNSGRAGKDCIYPYIAYVEHVQPNQLETIEGWETFVAACSLKTGVPVDQYWNVVEDKYPYVWKANFDATTISSINRAVRILQVRFNRPLRVSFSAYKHRAVTNIKDCPVGVRFYLQQVKGNRWKTVATYDKINRTPESATIPQMPSGTFRMVAKTVMGVRWQSRTITII